MVKPKDFRRKPRRDGGKGGTPLATVLEAVEERRDAHADAARLDAALAAGKRLKPPPTRFAPRSSAAGAVKPAPRDWLWDGADSVAEVDE